MDLHQHLEEQLKQDFELLKELEEKLRIEVDPRLRRNWENAVKDIKCRISDRKIEIEYLINQSISLSTTVCDSDPMIIQDDPNQRKVERLKRDLNLAQKQSDELTELISLIVDEIDENRGDAVRQSNLSKKKKRYEEERSQHDQEVEKFQMEIQQLTSR